MWGTISFPLEKTLFRRGKIVLKELHPLKTYLFPCFFLSDYGSGWTRWKYTMEPHNKQVWRFIWPSRENKLTSPRRLLISCPRQTRPRSKEWRCHTWSYWDTENSKKFIAVTLSKIFQICKCWLGSQNGVFLNHKGSLFLKIRHSFYPRKA